MTTLEKIRAELHATAEMHEDGDYYLRDKWVNEIIDKYAEQEPISVSVSEKEPDEISEEVTLRFFRNTLKVRWQDLVIYNVEWLKKNWQMEMDIVCGVKPCTDAVSRQAVYEILEGNWNTDFLRAEVENLPSVRPQEQKWIPVSERLPKKREWYLSVFMEKDTGFQLIPRVADYIGNGKWRIIDEDGLAQEYRDILECIAWMPLPEPYKAESEDKE